jgi:replication factor C large subunit
VLPFLSVMTHHCKNRELTVRMAARYELDAEHVSFVTGSGESTNKVQDIVADAEERRERAAVEHSGGAFAGGSATDPGEPDEDDGAEAAETEAQATLGGAESGSDDDGDERSADAEDAEEDDQQSGLGDFM